jgi:putative tryptophan/tyrosine transport system substrate-binding protein
MRRRAFITFLGGAAATWPLAARAQQDGRVRLVGMLMGASADDRMFKLRLTSFHETLVRLGWVEGRNLRTEVHYGTGDTERTRDGATALVALAPDVILVNSTPAAKAVRQLSMTVPIVFIAVNDPVSTGLVGNLTRPENNATGFPLFEPSIAGKWLELLKEAAPRIRRIAQLSDPANTPETYFTAIEAAARALAIQVFRAEVRNVLDIVRAIDTFAVEPDGALLFPPDGTTASHRETIFQLAIQHSLPSIYWSSSYVREGGLMSYGPNPVDFFRSAAIYVDRILRGAKVSELPVVFPTKFELVINLRAAKTIGLAVPPTLLARADEVIE